MPPSFRGAFVVAVQSKEAHWHTENGRLVLEFVLAEGVRLSEPHCARLHSVDGLAVPVAVETNFTAPQAFNGEQRRLLGFSSHLPGPVLPVTDNFLPQHCSITLSPLRGPPFTGYQEVNILIQVAPETWFKC